jgi:hypothetical protein
LFVACGVLVVGLAIYYAVAEGRPSNLPAAAYAMIAGIIYMTALFLFVAVKGKAPHGWLPWEGTEHQRSAAEE